MAKDKLAHLYRYNVTQTEVLGKDYTDLDLRGRACVWVPGSGIFLPQDRVGQPGLAFGVIQRVFVTGKDPEKPLQAYQTKGRTVTVLQHGIIPDFLSAGNIYQGDWVMPYGLATGTTGSDPDDIAKAGMWVKYPGLDTAPIDSGEETTSFCQNLWVWPFIVQAWTVGAEEGDRFTAYIH